MSSGSSSSTTAEHLGQADVVAVFLEAEGTANDIEEDFELGACEFRKQFVNDC